MCTCLEPVIDFSLEPNGNKLAIIHGEPPTRISVSFHKINEKGTPPTMISKWFNSTLLSPPLQKCWRSRDVTLYSGHQLVSL